MKGMWLHQKALIPPLSMFLSTGFLSLRQAPKFLLKVEHT